MCEYTTVQPLSTSTALPRACSGLPCCELAVYKKRLGGSPTLHFVELSTDFFERTYFCLEVNVIGVTCFHLMDQVRVERLEHLCRLSRCFTSTGLVLHCGGKLGLRIADLSLSQDVRKLVFARFNAIFGFDTINEAHKQYHLLDTIFNYIFYLGPPGKHLYLSPENPPRVDKKYC